MDQPDGQDLGQLNGDDKGEGGDDLECNDELPERREPGPKGFKLVFREKVMKGSKGQEKNGHILPQGQWYAPSEVINDALIMPEYARACQSMPEYA